LAFVVVPVSASVPVVAFHELVICDVSANDRTSLPFT